MAGIGGMEMRRVRFESIEFLHRDDLGIAGEIWLRDVCKASWATRDAMKIAAHFARYMVAPDVNMLTLGRLDQQLQLGRDELKGALRLMKLYRVVEDFDLELDGVRAALHLTMLQRLEVLEVRLRLEDLSRCQRPFSSADAGRWVPRGSAGNADEGAPASQVAGEELV